MSTRTKKNQAKAPDRDRKAQSGGGAEIGSGRETADSASNAGTPADPRADSAQTLRERIHTRAHEIHLSRNSGGDGAAHEGDALSDWLQAERELNNAADAGER